MSEITGDAHGEAAAGLLASGQARGRWTLDPQASRVEFQTKSLWGAITVRGKFDGIHGEAVVSADGSVRGRLAFDAASITTKNRQRDKHLRSAEFFDVTRQPEVVVSITEAQPNPAGELSVSATLQAAGHVQPLNFTAQIQDASPSTVTVSGQVVVDRTAFGMTWSPMKVASYQTRVIVVATFRHPD